MSDENIENNSPDTEKSEIKGEQEETLPQCSTKAAWVKDCILVRK